ncbi:MAG: CPBP family intramembrane metalloprotease, partial [Treponema sp.]|nr:CPBP family intramembrane metalloprotease [Treponema sp.]
IIYRKYLPCALYDFFHINENVNENAFSYSTIFVELIPILLFAFAHRYLGIAAVAFSFFAGVLFRLLFKKTSLILCPIIVHFLYNITTLIFALM